MTNQRALIDRAWNALERLSRALGQVGPDEVCCEGLTPRQTSLLRTLAAGEGARLSDLAASARLSPSAMTRIVERLEKLELVQRVRGVGDDGRAASVRITARGREVRARIDDLMRERSHAILSAIPAAQRQAVLSNVETLCKALESEVCCRFNAPECNLLNITK